MQRALYGTTQVFHAWVPLDSELNQPELTWISLPRVRNEKQLLTPRNPTS